MYRVTDEELYERIGDDPYRNWMQVKPPRKSRATALTVALLFWGLFLLVATLFWMEAGQDVTHDMHGVPCSISSEYECGGQH